MTVSREIFADGQLAVETRMLKHDAEPPPHRGRFAREIVTEQLRAARLDWCERREQLEQGRFAAAVGSEKAEDLAARDCERHVGERRAIAIVKAERMRFDRARSCANRIGHGLRWIGDCRRTHFKTIRPVFYGSPSPPAGCVPCSGNPISARCHPSWNAVVRSSPLPCPEDWPTKSSPVSW